MRKNRITALANIEDIATPYRPIFTIRTELLNNRFTAIDQRYRQSRRSGSDTDEEPECVDDLRLLVATQSIEFDFDENVFGLPILC